MQHHHQSTLQATPTSWKAGNKGPRLSYSTRLSKIIKHLATLKKEVHMENSSSIHVKLGQHHVKVLQLHASRSNSGVHLVAAVSSRSRSSQQHPAASFLQPYNNLAHLTVQLLGEKKKQQLVQYAGSLKQHRSPPLM